MKNDLTGIGLNDMQDRPDVTYSIYTADGKMWSYQMIGTTTGGDFNALATNGKRTIAVGLYGSVVYTDDGKTWRSSSNPFSYKGRMGRAHLFDVVWGAGNRQTSNSRISYGDLRNIIWTGNFFVASDQVYGTYTSKDGVNCGLPASARIG
ncbi:hypothetical protein J23TS9_54140 [Paenibacillus sp. J23TS9]|uniref:hypothetical protein n=1 Tax=Paenibacillus sp. J23TS9 TaxID=2807193 RepID=UPI001B2EB91B|nr:hypothetical protein [Paenibacillus sp. J23TS9]GIP30284.1 hypothetical protein J23TS9_54140 [Paenibacillus sp. J23TS9]